MTPYHLAQAPRFRGDPRHPFDQAPDPCRHRGGGTTSRSLGHNVKLGRGGIREIEFFAQTQQLIFGGRDPSASPPPVPWRDASTRLAAAGHVVVARGRRRIWPMPYGFAAHVSSIGCR
jgi:hypothetical protein